MGKHAHKPMKWPLVILLWGMAAAALIAIWIAAPASGDGGISVSCYNLDVSEHPLGNVVAYDISRAGYTCNSVYLKCKGKCVGCFSDSDYLDVVCVDARGTIFLK